MKTITSIKRFAFNELISEFLLLDDLALELQGLSEGKTKADKVKWRRIQMLCSLELAHSGAIDELAHDPNWDELIFREAPNGLLQVIQRRKARPKAVRQFQPAKMKGERECQKP